MELLVEPWELGIRQAKEFLLAAEELDAAEARRLGLVNRVVPRAELDGTHHGAGPARRPRPPVTAQVVKDSLNNVGELMGKSASWRYHFMAHQWAHNTATALSRARAAQADGLDERGLRGPGPGRRGDPAAPPAKD